jgi:predicted negative regulator of RcsB-dependent stress response
MARHHPTAHRIPRDVPPSSDDVFVERVLETSAWAKENSRLLMVAGSVVLLLLLGFLYYRSYTTRLRNTAEAQLSAIRPTVTSGNAALAVRDLDAFVARFGNTPAAREARLLLAEAHLNAGQPQPAIEAVRDMANDLDNPLGVSAAFLLGGAYETSAQPDQAVEAYIRIADDATHDFQKVRALDAAARIRYEQGNPGAAVQLYDRILNILPEGDPERPVYLLRRGEASARAPAGT